MHNTQMVKLLLFVMMNKIEMDVFGKIFCKEVSKLII